MAGANIAQPARTNSVVFAAIGVALFASVVIWTVLCHEPWGDETHTWRLAIDSQGLRALYANTRFEGHPLFFHALLQGVGFISRSWWAAVVLHTIIACASAWIVLRHAPFSRIERAFVVSSYYFAYEYAVIVRAYALGVLLALIVCALWTSRTRRPYLIALSLLLLANTSVLGLILALALSATFLLESLGEKKNGIAVHAQMAVYHRCRVASALLLVAVCTAYVIWQVLPPTNAAFQGGGIAEHRITLWMIGAVVSVPLQAFAPLAIAPHGVASWGSWLLAPGTRLQTLLIDVASVTLTVAALYTVSRRRSSMVLFCLSWIGFLTFFAFLFSASVRHLGYLLVAWVLARWLATAAQPERAVGWWQRVPDALLSYRTPVAIALLLPSVLAAIQFVIADIRYPFSDARRVANVLRADSLSRIPVVAVSTWSAMNVAALLDRPFFLPDQRRSNTFTAPVFPTSRVMSGLVDTIATRFVQADCALIVIASPSWPLSPTLRRRAQLLTATKQPQISGETFSVWLLPGARVRGCDAMLKAPE